MNELIAKWHDEQYPLLNGLTFSDGTHYPVLAIDSPRHPLPMKLSHGQPKSLAEMVPLQWGFFNVLCEAESISGGLKAIAGEGSMGSDGIVALLDEKRILRWIAFFDFANKDPRAKSAGYLKES